MLVLSRKQGESILIGDDIELVLVSIRGEKARIGIDAPKNCKIVRKELINQLTDPEKKPEMGGSCEQLT